MRVWGWWVLLNVSLALCLRWILAFALRRGRHGACKSDGGKLHLHRSDWGREAALSPCSRISRSKSPWSCCYGIQPVTLTKKKSTSSSFDVSFPRGKSHQLDVPGQSTLALLPISKERARKEREVRRIGASFSGKPREMRRGSSPRHPAKPFHSYCHSVLCTLAKRKKKKKRKTTTTEKTKIHLVHIKDHLLLKQILGWPEPVFSLT